MKKIKTTMKKIFALIIFVLLFSAGIFSQNLVGTWNIVAYKTLKVNEPGYTLSDIGSITFYKDASGELNVNYSILGVEASDNSVFRWAISQNMTSLQGDLSEFIKTWIVIKSKAKMQIWQATNGKDTVFVLELKKQSKNR